MHTEVVVVGAGPTGLVLAAELALAGVEVEVLERLDAPSGQSRGGRVNPRTAEVLEMRGLLDGVADRAAPTESAGGHFAGLPVPLDARAWSTRHPDGMMVPQDRLESVLETHLADLGVKVRRGVDLVDLDPGRDSVTAITSEGALTASYLVGCDGAHSTVRKLVGAAFPGRPGTITAVSADIELASRSATVPTTIGHISGHTRMGNGYWMMLHPFEGYYRAVFGGPEQACLSRTAPVIAEEVSRALTAVHGPETTLSKLRWGTRFTDAARQLESYRHGRVLFAGDAAHIHSPVGGQGVNLGIQDAINLGWKLAAEVRGTAHPDLLDSYHRERHPVGARVIATARAQTLLMNPPPDADDALALCDIVADLARTPDGNRHLAGLMSGLDIRYDLGDPHPLVGARMPDLDITTASGPLRVSHALRAGRGLLAGAVEGVAAPESVPVVVGQLVDAPSGVDRVLVRPDGHVCWVGAGDPPWTRWF